MIKGIHEVKYTPYISVYFVYSCISCISYNSV